MKTTLRWIVHCEQTVLLHLRETPVSPLPPKEWWIMLYALDAVLGDTDIIMKYLQGKQLTLDSQMNLLRKLKDTIMTKSNMVTMNPDLVNEVGLVYNVGWIILEKRKIKNNMKKSDHFYIVSRYGKWYSCTQSTT